MRKSQKPEWAQGITRKLIVRFELSEGLHLYGQPVPEGMIPTTVVPEGENPPRQLGNDVL